MHITRRNWLALIGVAVLVSCRAPAEPPRPQTVTLIVEGMT